MIQPLEQVEHNTSNQVQISATRRVDKVEHKLPSSDFRH